MYQDIHCSNQAVRLGQDKRKTQLKTNRGSGSNEAEGGDIGPQWWYTAFRGPIKYHRLKHTC